MRRAGGYSGKGGTLMVTSHTDRTSPVVRGKWVLTICWARRRPRRRRMFRR